MNPTWNHPTLGLFEYDGYDWSAKAPAPAFEAFAWRPVRLGRPTTPGVYFVTIATDGPDSTPSPEAATLLATVLANAPALVPVVAEALWNDFNGEDPDSGMWWHDGLEEVGEGLDEYGLTSPETADDVLKLLHLVRIAVYPDTYGAPVAELIFDAPFEEEHGVGILTDGHQVLGAGYSSSVQPYH